MADVRFLEAAKRALARLDKSTAKRIIHRVRWLADNVEHVKLDPLAGDLAGLYKLRVGDYRVVYQLLKEEHAILVHFLGHRRDVYRRR